MRILMFGDVVGEAGSECFCRQAPKLKQEYRGDLIIVNGENSAKGNGITPQSADLLFSGGADVITTGNHCFRRKCDRIFENERILRPANYPDGAPGSGVCVLDCGSCSVAVINLMGTAFLDALDNPKNYDGKNICFKAQYYHDDSMKNGVILPGRFAMQCCANDISFIGFLARLPFSMKDSVASIKNKDWIYVRGNVKIEFKREYSGKGPVIYITSHEPAQKAEEDIVYFT